MNPTAGTVTLAAPVVVPADVATGERRADRRRGVRGVGAGDGAALTRRSRSYTIYATDTGDASGAPLAPGAYIVNIENLHNVKVTITAS